VKTPTLIADQNTIDPGEAIQYQRRQAKSDRNSVRIVSLFQVSLEHDRAEGALFKVAILRFQDGGSALFLADKSQSLVAVGVPKRFS
jgi:hypothetical protein